ncbi:MAG TPA: bifunctional riboflavin kinase/FAD synthetase [Gemmatimonadaceae bacterium]|nr:bifunctional riboflavin kinase/FAD synthetase [Gemmatimonadaceae bacterium]
MAAAPSVVTVGTFDGVHRGHRFVLDRLVARAHAQGLRSVVVTFEPHPLRVVNPPAAPRLLTTLDEKREALVAVGVDEVAVVPFDTALAALEADQFVDRILLGRFGMAELFVGHDHGFGRGRSGDPVTLERMGRERGFAVHVVPPVAGRDGAPVSSTSIRRAVAAGDLSRAADGLARPYAVSGTVEHGDGRGAALGYRTLNVATPAAEKLLPPDGVYAVRVDVPGARYAGMLNLGGRPTFGDDRRTIEAHLFDARGDWYGQHVRVAFIARIRGVQRFPDPDALIAQLRKDEEKARVLVARAGIVG